MINSNDFTLRYYSTANPSRKAEVERFINGFAALSQGIPLPDALKDKSLLCRAFYLRKTGNISRSHYQKIKEYLLNLFDYVGISGAVPTRKEVMDSQETQYYFRGINEILHFIDNVGGRRISSYDPTRDLVRVKSICVLGWIGLTPAEISNLKLSDLIKIGSDGYKIISSKGTHEVYGEPFTALYYLSSLREYNGLPTTGSRGRRIVLKGASEYLFKAQTPDCEKLDGLQIVQILNRFNSSASTGTSILFRNLYKNALFLEIYNDKSSKPLTTKITDTIGCTYSVALGYKVQYLQFAEAMDNNKI